MKKIFITATSWSNERDAKLKRILGGAIKKYRELTIVVGYSAVALRIATIATSLGIPTQMIAPDIDVITGKHIDNVGNITVISTQKTQFANAVTKDGAFGITGVVAFDDGDPVALRAIASGTKVWLLESERVV